MRKPSKKSLVKKLDKAVADFVKKRDGNVCQKSGEYVTGSNCHASHVIPRSKGNRLRWDPLNLKVLSFHWHINWWHKNPTESGKWFAEKFPERMEYLNKHKNETVKYTVKDMQDMLKKFSSIV